MSSIASSDVTIETSLQSVPSVPSWMGEITMVAHYLTHLGLLEQIAARVRFARARFGTYDTIDFVVVLIDEVDAGIYYSHMPKVWEGISRAAREFNCQVFATTHSYECLQAAYNGIAQADMAREFRYLRLERGQQDIVAQTYAHDLLGAALSRGWEVR